MLYAHGHWEGSRRTCSPADLSVAMCVKRWEQTQPDSQKPMQGMQMCAQGVILRAGICRCV